MDRQVGEVLNIIVRAIIATTNNMNYQKLRVEVVAANRFRPEFRRRQYTYVQLPLPAQSIVDLRWIVIRNQLKRIDFKVNWSSSVAMSSHLFHLISRDMNLPHKMRLICLTDFEGRGLLTAIRLATD